MKNHFLAVAAVFAVISCSKQVVDPPVSPEAGSFVFEGVEYNSLQSAVNAVSMSGSELSSTIYLKTDAFGYGAEFPKGDNLDIVLDLGGNSYTIAEGGSIDVSDNTFAITGNKGAIISRSNLPVIKASGHKTLTFGGETRLEGEYAIQSSSEVLFDEDFSGSVEGNVYLFMNQALVLSNACSINIPVLTVEGDDSSFCVDCDCSSPVVKIGQIVSDADYPVSTAVSSALSLHQGTAHVHDFEEDTIGGNCLVPEVTMKVCRECGYVKAGDVVEGEYGKCCSEDLLFHKKVEPTEVKYGTVEYYECLLCGRLYEDPLALKPFDGNIVLLPTKFKELDSALDPDIFLDAEFDPIALISFLGNSLIKIGFWIKSFVKLTKDRDFFYGICDRLKAISSQLSEISNSLKMILADVETIPYQVKLNNRFSRIRELHEYTQICLFAMDTLMKNPCLTEKQKEDTLIKVLKDWGGMSQMGKPLHPHEEIYSLLKEYVTISTGPNIPEMYSEVLALQPSFAWEHESYPFAQATLAFEVAVISEIFLCAELYNMNCRTFNSDTTRNGYTEMVRSAYKDYLTATEKEFKRMSHRDSVYRRYSPLNQVFYRQLDNEYDFDGFFSGHDGERYFPRENDNHRAERTCIEMMNYARTAKGKYGTSIYGCSFMSKDTAKHLYDRHKEVTKGKEDKKTAYDLIADAKFIGSPDSSEVKKRGNWRIILDSPKEYAPDRKGDYEYVHSWTIYWRSYKGSTNEDCLGINNVLKDNGEADRLKYVHKCNIKVPSGKTENVRITSEMADKYFTAIIVADK